jgi:hypothetical protein
VPVHRMGGFFTPLLSTPIGIGGRVSALPRFGQEAIPIALHRSGFRPVDLAGDQDLLVYGTRRPSSERA